MRSAKHSLPLLLGLVCALAGCGEKSVGPPLPARDPAVTIYEPPATTGSGGYEKVVVFGWRSNAGEEAGDTRFLWSPITDTTGAYNASFDMIGDLNRNPARYESKWSPWKSFSAPGDSGRSTVIGDDEVLQPGKYYIFAVQERDELGHVTARFDPATNARRFAVKLPTGPTLSIYEPYLVGFRFIGPSLSPEKRDLPPGVPLRFTWLADDSYYGGEIAGYRYGWDIADVTAWDAPFRADLTDGGESTFNAGTHTLFIEALDRAGYYTLARITVNVVPWPMDRNLLFVDDYSATAQPLPDYSNPSKGQHDSFWLGICSKAEGFDPAVDVYDCAANQLQPPPAAVIGRYKNIIWSYSSQLDAWSKEIQFTPESDVGKGRIPVNYLAIFLLRGGHAWTSGRSERTGGLAATVPQVTTDRFPLDLRCEVGGGQSDCRGSLASAKCFPYRDDCVTMLDKIDGNIRSDGGMPFRQVAHFDCMRFAYRDRYDPMTTARPGLPLRLSLWEEVTKPGRYFDPSDTLGPQGFTYVEVYDPAYWMKRNGVSSQLCFHPMYRMRSYDERSALDGGTVAIWVSKYDTVVPDVASGVAVAAPSVHFGFPLWFFARAQVDSLAAAIFDEWEIRKAP
jgi:hypothetical protein